MSNPSESIFTSKYKEFCDDLVGACPEYEVKIKEARALGEKEYRTSVFPKTPRVPGQNPGCVLPGVVIEDSVWASLSDKSKKAIIEYLQLLDIASMTSGDVFSQDFVDEILKGWRGRMNRTDFSSLTEKFASIFGKEGKTLPPLPEKFLKGKLAKLAEDMVREFSPEDFGLLPEDISACEKDPTRAFEILMSASAQKPEILQGVMMRIAKKLQAKMASGEFRPQDLAAEAEEMMKEFQGNPAFVEMLNWFRESFSFGDKESARKVGRDGESRLSIARERLRKKLDARKKK